MDGAQGDEDGTGLDAQEQNVSWASRDLIASTTRNSTSAGPAGWITRRFSGNIFLSETIVSKAFDTMKKEC